MRLWVLIFGIAIALTGQDAFAKNRLTDPLKIARESQKRGGVLVQRASPRWPPHHKLPQGEGDRIVAWLLGGIQVNGITEARG